MFRTRADVTRFRVTSMPEKIDFESVLYRPLESGGVQKKTSGLEPICEDFRVDIAGGWAFKYKITTRNVNKEALNLELEKLKDEFSGADDDPALLKQCAELQVSFHDHAPDTTQSVPAFLTGGDPDIEDMLYVGSTDGAKVFMVVKCLAALGVGVERLFPWTDCPSVYSDVHSSDLPVANILGCRFLRWLPTQEKVYLKEDQAGAKVKTCDGATLVLKGPAIKDLEIILGENPVITPEELGNGRLESADELLEASYIVEGAELSIIGDLFQIKKLEMKKRSGPKDEVVYDCMRQIDAMFALLDKHFVVFAATIGYEVGELSHLDFEELPEPEPEDDGQQEMFDELEVDHAA